MKITVKECLCRLVCSAAILMGVQMASAVDDDSYLLWAFEDPSIKSLSGSDIYVDELSLGGKTANGIRVKQISGGTESYLNLSYGGASVGSVWGIPDENGDYYAGPGYAHIGNVDASTKFMIEIGNLTGSEWLTLAISETLTYQELDNLHHIWHDELDIPERLPWTGGAYNVPEPSSGLLLLLGGALVALRRRRRRS